MQATTIDDDRTEGIALDEDHQMPASREVFLYRPKYAKLSSSNRAYEISARVARLVVRTRFQLTEIHL